MKKGMQAYLANQKRYEESDLNEPNLLIDDMIEEAESLGEPLQEKSTLKHLVDNDLRETVPPQLFSAMSGLLNLMAAIDREEK